MRTSAIISSSLLAIAVSCAPVDLPKLPVALPNLGLGSLPTGLPAVPVKVPTEFPTTLPSELSANNVKLPVEKLPVRRTDLPVVDDALKGLKISALPKLNTGDLKLPLKRADFPVVSGLLKDVTVPALPKLPVGDVKLPLKRAELPVVNGLVEDVKIPNIVTLPTVPKLPVGNVNLPVRRNINVNAPVSLAVDDLIEPSDVNTVQPNIAAPAVGLPVVPALPKIARDIKQSLPVVGGADVPLDAGKIQVGTVDQYVDQLTKGTKVESLPKVAREITQSLPVVGGADVPLDAGKIQVGTADKYVDEVVEGTTLKKVPVLQVVKGTTVKDLPNLGSRDIKQSLPVVGGVDVPLDAGKIQVGTADTYVEDVIKGSTTGL